MSAPQRTTGRCAALLYSRKVNNNNASDIEKGGDKHVVFFIYTGTDFEFQTSEHEVAVD